MPKRFVNRAWGSGRQDNDPVTPSEFEVHALSLGLTESEYSSSRELREWCKRNKERCFIPEWLLKHWGMSVDQS